MNWKSSLVFGLFVIGLFPALTIYAGQSQPKEYTDKGAVDVALLFLKNSSTFRFDGITDSIKIVSVEKLRTPWKWQVTISFECRHSGYGDRTGQILLEVITPHNISIVVSEGKVTRAVMDEKWNELEQREIVNSEILPPEYARDAAVEYAIGNHKELQGLQTPNLWEFRDLAPVGLLGSSTLQYSGDGWTVNVTYPVVWKPVYTVKIEYSGMLCFTWKGIVDQLGQIEETEFTLK